MHRTLPARTRLVHWGALLAILVGIVGMNLMSPGDASPAPDAAVGQAVVLGQPVAASDADGSAHHEPMSCPGCAAASTGGSSTGEAPMDPMGCLAAAGCVMVFVLFAIAALDKRRTVGRWWYCRSSRPASTRRRQRWLLRTPPSLIELSILRT